MAQHDYSIANQSGSAFRADLNTALSAIVTQNSGTSSPATTFAHQMWADTTNNVMKLRNAANSGWIELYQLDGEWTDIAFENGTAAAPSIYFKDSGTDTGFYSPGANQVGISTGGTSALVVDASQRVGIGTATVPSLLSLRQGSDDSHLRFRQSSEFDVGSVGHVIDSRNIAGNANTQLTLRGNPLTFWNNGEAARIDSSGRLLVGTTTARTNIDYALGTSGSQLQVEQANVATNLSIVQNYDSGTIAAPATLTLARSGATSLGSTAIVASGNSVGEINFSGSDGTNFTVAALIRGEVDGTPGADDMPGRLVFSTTADGASSPTERMRIDNAGNVYLKVMQVGGSANVHWSSSAGQLFVTSSSERFKHDITDYDKGLDELMQMQPKYFVYNDEPNQKQRAGFIAEDFHDLGLTEYVEYWNDDEGNATVPSEIGYANMVAILVKSIQQQQAMIAELQAKVAALEAS